MGFQMTGGHVTSTEDFHETSLGKACSFHFLALYSGGSEGKKKTSKREDTGHWTQDTGHWLGNFGSIVGRVFNCALILSDS